MRNLYDITNLAYISSVRPHLTGISRAALTMARSLVESGDLSVRFAASKGQQARAQKLVGNLRPDSSFEKVMELEHVFFQADDSPPAGEGFDAIHLNWRSVSSLRGLEEFPIVVTVPDLIVKDSPAFFSNKMARDIENYFDSLLGSLGSKHGVIVNTLEAKESVLRHYPKVADGQVSIVPLTSNLTFDFRNVTPQFSRFQDLPTGPFVLSVATREPRKDLNTLLKAYLRLAQDRKHPLPDLVLVGSDGWLDPVSTKLLESIRSIGTSSVVELLSLGDWELRELYQRATLFCFPSLAEGFGLPVIEAMSFGVPTIVSDIRAYEHYPPDAPLRFAPGDSEGLAAQMNRLLDSPELARESSLRALEVASCYTLETTRTKLVESYQFVATHSSKEKSPSALALIDRYSSKIHIRTNPSAFANKIETLWVLDDESDHEVFDYIRYHDALVWLGSRSPSKAVFCGVYLTPFLSKEGSSESGLDEKEFVVGTDSRIKIGNLVAHLQPSAIFLGTPKGKFKIDGADVQELVTDLDIVRIANCHEEGNSQVEEVEVVSNFFEEFGPKVGTMFDVGAHRGSSSKPFLAKDWIVHAFEPDSENASQYRRKFGHLGRAYLETSAVADYEGQQVFYRGSVSSGISSFTPFHKSHEAAGEVRVIPLSSYIEAKGVEHVNFLKIDVEGHELGVLDGFPWNLDRPDVILAEFELAKSQFVGYTPDDLALRLQSLGYSVFVSEWYPIIEYGGRHSFRQVYRWKAGRIPEDSWGNLYAFIRDPGLGWLFDQHHTQIYRASKPSQGKSRNGTDDENRIKVFLSPLYEAIARYSPRAAAILARGWRALNRR